MKTNKFIIYSNYYNDDSGGTVVLHQLCHFLNQIGEQAFIWPAKKPVFDYKTPFQSIAAFIKYFRKKRNFPLNDLLNTPIAKYSDLEDAIVVYPEIIDGNPLLANQVVRWLLHKPGYHRGYHKFGKNELFFYYLRAYDDPSLNRCPDNLLYINKLRDDVYKQINFDVRNENSCYILRKGTGRTIVHDLQDSILIDGLSHEECAKIFNQVKYCISYDTYTMYSVYAAMCGCISIVIPEEGLEKEAWMPNEEDRYGLAYGFHDIDYAVNTKEKLLESLKQKEKQMLNNIHEFVEKCKIHFNGVL